MIVDNHHFYTFCLNWHGVRWDADGDSMIHLVVLLQVVTPLH